MNEIRNILLPQKEIFANLKEYITNNASVETWVGRKKIKKNSPIIVFEEPRNELQSRSTTYDNTTRIMNYNINVYCSKLTNSYEIVQELAILICELMQGYYHMTGGIIATIPTYEDNDANSYQVNLRFTTRYKPSQNKLY